MKNYAWQMISEMLIDGITDSIKAIVKFDLVPWLQGKVENLQNQEK